GGGERGGVGVRLVPPRLLRPLAAPITPVSAACAIPSLRRPPSDPASARRRPRGVGVVGRDRLRGLRGLRPEILLEYDALRVDLEGHDTALAVLGGPRDQRESAGHLAVLEVAACATRRAGALPRQDAEKVSVVRLRARGLLGDLVALGSGRREERTERA